MKSANTNSSLRVVELRPAYTWDCDDCGRENFARGIVPEFSEEEERELRDEHGVQPWEAGKFLMMPPEVQCSHCGSRFASGHFKDA
jgi:DNA-directed RNA polymerase subunit RPC12/RpoP